MAHRPISHHLFTLDGNVLTTGGSKNLAKGQFTIVNVEAPTVNGAAVVGDFAGLSAKTNYEIRLGKAKVPNSRTNSNSKPYSTGVFKIGDVTEIRTNFPKVIKQKFDDLVVGYEGINDDTKISLAEGQTTLMDITLSGENISYFTGGSNSHVVKVHFGKEVGETDKEMIERVVARLKKETFPGGMPITDAVDIKVVNSDNIALAGTAYVFSELKLVDDGTSNALGLVQAQYPAYIVQRTNRDGLESTYTILHPSASALTNYVSKTKSYVKDCADCAAGYAALSEGGVIYSVSIEDEGADLSTTVDDLPGFVAGSVSKKGQSGDTPSRGEYLVVVDNELTAAEIAAFVAAAPVKATALITKIGTVLDVCYNSTTTSTAWVDVKTCYASTGQYTIQLKDDDCDGSRLAALQAYYPTLTIAPVGTGGCQRTYTTTVVSDIVCEECSDIFLQSFITEAPADFEFTSWEAVPAAVDADAKMGIRFTGKPFIIKPTDVAVDQIPFVETSASIEVSGGYVEEVNNSFEPIFSDIFEVKRFSRKQDRDNLGYHLLYLERQSKAYFDGELPHENNLYARGILGEESVLKFDKQYIQYAITIQDSKPSQSMGRHSDIAMEYSIWVELGQQAALEAYLNKLAVKAGLDPVQAVAN